MLRKKYVISAVSLMAIVPVSAMSAPIECGQVVAEKYGHVPTFAASGAPFYKTPQLQVDADGAPDSYRVDGNGLSYTCNGVVAVVNGVRRTLDYDTTHHIPKESPENWEVLCRSAWSKALKTGNYSGLAIFGFATGTDGKPKVQAAGDDFPGQAFITTTSVTIPEAPADTQRRYIDANKIPYVVLSSGFVSDNAIKPADIAVVYWPDKKKYAFAVYGDGGRLGEASVRLHNDLGNDPIIMKGETKRAKRGIGAPVLTVVFPGKTTHPTLNAEKWRKEISEIGEKALKDWGGEARLAACAK